MNIDDIKRETSIFLSSTEWCDFIFYFLLFD